MWVLKKYTEEVFDSIIEHFLVISFFYEINFKNEFEKTEFT